MLRKNLIFALWQRIVLSWVKFVYTLIEATCCKAGSVASPETMASLWTVLKWRLRFDTTLKALIQMSHMKGFSSLCTSICCFSLLCEEKLFRHLSHQNGLTCNMFLISDCCRMRTTWLPNTSTLHKTEQNWWWKWKYVFVKKSVSKYIKINANHT